MEWTRSLWEYTAYANPYKEKFRINHIMSSQNPRTKMLIFENCNKRDNVSLMHNTFLIIYSGF